MSTVDKAFADKLASANGQLYPAEPFEPPVILIVEYTNAWGNLAYGITFEGQDQDKYMRPTDYVRSPRIYFERSQVKSPA